jgi:FkbM family methyltransferase
MTELVAKLKQLRLARLGRLLLHGRDLTIVDKIKLNYFPRYKRTKVSFEGKDLEIADAASFLGAYKEIFIDKVYAFSVNTSTPRIIDAGANIGLATIFFKRAYPNSRILAVEADPTLFDILKRNIASLGLRNVEVLSAAIWNSDRPVSFVCEGGASGHVTAAATQTGKSKVVPGLRLKSKLADGIDFLKLDIEGAEYDVLEDCREELKKVTSLFVEYHCSAESPQRLARILDIISEAGFRYHIQDALTSQTRAPFVNRHLIAGMDLQLNISAYRPPSSASSLG